MEGFVEALPCYQDHYGEETVSAAFFLADGEHREPETVILLNVTIL
jgi:hypothetical protein